MAFCHAHLHVNFLNVITILTIDNFKMANSSFCILEVLFGITFIIILLSCDDLDVCVVCLHNHVNVPTDHERSTK